VKLIEATRIAIWDRDRTIIALATGIWGMDVASLIQGKSLHTGTIESPIRM
jgi:hypothetical protein